MATQEERITTVEFDLKQFKTETVKVYQDMAFEMTMVKGLTEDAIKRLAMLNSTMEKRFDATNERLSRLETTLDEHTRLLGEHTVRFDRVETLLTEILERLPKS